MGNSFCVYGFNYRFDGKNYATDIVASSADEAVARLRAMADSVLIGPLVEASAPKSAEFSEAAA